MIVFVDGASKGNPGLSFCSIAIFHKLNLGVGTNNEAEYKALFHAMKIIHRSDSAVTVEFRTDSELVVKQLSGEYQIKEPRLKILNDAVKTMLYEHGGWKVVYVPRKEIIKVLGH